MLGQRPGHGLKAVPGVSEMGEAYMPHLQKCLHMFRNLAAPACRMRRHQPHGFFILHSSFLIFIILHLSSFICTAHAQQALTRNGEQLDIAFDIPLQADDLGTSDAYIYTPYIICKDDSVALPAVGVYGYKRYVYLKRNRRLPLTGQDETVYRASRAPQTHSYTASLPWQSRLEECRLVLSTRHIACCNRSRGTSTAVIDRLEPYRPVFPFVQPTDIRLTAKTRNLSGSALVTFPVSRTEIHESYMRNAVELEKIHSSIDSVRDDPDVTITSITIKGYASPESSYANNARLAQGRTQALADYVAYKYGISRRIINIDYEPENWEGVTQYIRKYRIAFADEILRIIDFVSDPDQREAQIKQRYPQQYALLLQDCYPSLRKSDYRIDYTIRSYNDPEEIRRLVDSRPQNLSLPEFYLAASHYEPGSPEFCHVYEVAVRLFPDDPTCNLNAACSAMQRGDYVSAKAFLDKAGSSTQAMEAREIYKKMKNEEFSD